MTKENLEEKRRLVNFLLSVMENDLSSTEKIDDYLKSIGLNPEQVASNGVKKVRQMLMEEQARKTEGKFHSILKLKEKAEELVNRLINESHFSFTQFVKDDNVSVSFSNVENITLDDQKRILIKHFMLKLQSKETPESNGE